MSGTLPCSEETEVAGTLLRPVPSPSDEKRIKRKKKSPLNFKLNKQLVQASTTEAVLEIVGQSIQDFNVVNIGTALYRLALVAGPGSPAERETLRADDRFSELISEIVEVLEGDSESASLQHVVLAPKELSNVIWAATKLGLSDDVLFSAVSSHVIRHISHFDSVNLSLTLWGFAKMNQNAPDMFRAAIARILELLSEFEPHRICNTVWAYAKTGNTDLDLFKAIAEESLRKLHRFNHSNESMLLYSFALGHVHAPMLFKKAMAQQLPAIKSGEVQDPRSLSNLLWAVSELNLSDEFRGLYDIVAASATSNIHRYSLTHMATIASAYAKARIRMEELFKLIADECNNRPVRDPATWADLVVLNDAFEVLGVDSGIIKQTLNDVAEERKVQENRDRKVQLRSFVTDLVGTSAIAACVLILAALLKIYFARD